ncbi:MAG: hypothetical protein B5M53_02455 [Candidatus Cloacimonas sp. 4484_209]|nr:MAG: hypothetical protein B5M53_02455 [Candidatus Cloacimonas sp. 4484_209]
MIVIHSLENKEFKDWQSVITIGSFDGVHKGHCTILNTILQLAKECSCKTIVITFDPIPKYFFNNGEVKLITTLEEKLQIINKLKVDGVMVIPFDEKFSEIEPVRFLDMLWSNLHPYAITVGYNHHFGRKGEGNISLLKEFAIKKHIKLVTVDEVTIDNGQLYGAMLYIGTRPTFYESSPVTCEVYIMGFEGNIYDKEVTVYVLKRIRDEKKFNTAQNLIKQINSDEIIARQIIDNALLKEGG